MIAKLKEWITAVMLEYNYTKEEIITMYLNTVPYGSNAFGIKSAARTFFNKLPSELDIEEAAMLVGVVNAPTRYSPRSNPERALVRRNTVIGRMKDKGYIDRAPARFAPGIAACARLPSHFAQRGYRDVFPRDAAAGYDLLPPCAREFRCGRRRRLGV